LFTVHFFNFFFCSQKLVVKGGDRVYYVQRGMMTGIGIRDQAIFIRCKVKCNIEPLFFSMIKAPGN